MRPAALLVAVFTIVVATVGLIARERETMQETALLRVGAAVALATGGFVAFAVSGRVR